MALEPWVLVAAGGTAVGLAALAARGVLRMIGRRREGRLAQENQALERWWTALAGVPTEVLDAPMRRIVGGVMLRRLGHATRLSSDHPCLHRQREAINGFIAGSALDVPAPPRRNRETRTRHMEALRTLNDLVEGSAASGLLSLDDRASARRSIGRAIEHLEFLENRHANVEADALRRVTRALGQGNAPCFAGPQSRRLFPTQ